MLDTLNKSPHQARRRAEEQVFQRRSDDLAAERGFSAAGHEDAVRTVADWLVEDGRRPPGFEYECPPPMAAAAAPAVAPAPAVPRPRLV